MNCQAFDAALCAYLKRELPPAERSAAEAHLGACAACTELLQHVRRTTCEVLTNFLDDYIEGALAPAEKSVFERHLALCPPCIDFVVSYRATVRLGRAALEPEHAAQAPEELVRAVLDARSRSA